MTSFIADVGNRLESVPFKSIGSVVTRDQKSPLVPYRKKEFDSRVEDTGPRFVYICVFTFFPSASR